MTPVVKVCSIKLSLSTCHNALKCLLTLRVVRHKSLVSATTHFLTGKPNRLG